jgi:hypothetical protein
MVQMSEQYIKIIFSAQRQQTFAIFFFHIFPSSATDIYDYSVIGVNVHSHNLKVSNNMPTIAWRDVRFYVRANIYQQRR